VNEVVHLNFRHTEQEYVAATRLYMLKNTELVIRLVVFYVLFSAGVLLLSLISDFSLPVWFIVIVVGLLGLLIFHGTCVALPKRYFRGDPRFRDDYNVTFSDSGVHLKTQNIESSTAWNLYTRVLENDKFYVLVYGRDIHAIAILPKRAFLGSKQETTFRELLRRHVDHTLKLSAAEREKSAYLPPPSGPPDWR
jgi:hypothetical protein